MSRKARAYVRETLAAANWTPCDARPKQQNRHMLTRVVRAAPSWIIAMVGGDDSHIAQPHRGEQRGQAGIEGFEAMRVADDVAAMSEIRVEIDEIGEDHAAAGKSLQSVECRGEMRHVAIALDLLAGKAVPENISGLADRHDRATSAGEPIEKIAGRRKEREILAVGGAEESFARVAFERTRDHAPDIERVAYAPRDTAKIIEPFAAKNCFMRGDLENRICRSVADRRARPNMPGTEPFDDLYARRMAIAENTRKPALCDQRLRQFWRKARLGFRKIAPGGNRGRAGDFPMAGRRILAMRALDSVTPKRARPRRT